MASLENVADLISRPVEKFVSEPRYVSKYRESVRRASKRGKSAHKTLGVPNVNLNPPTEFLKKNSTGLLAKRPEVHHEHYRKPGYQHKLPDWQPIKAADREINQNNHSIDFTKRNIDEAKNLQPMKARKYYVDDKRGNSHSLKTSGLYPVYRNRKNYGQVPGENPIAPDNRSKLKERNTTSHKPRDKSKAKNRDENKSMNKPQVERKFQTRKADKFTSDDEKAEITVENELNKRDGDTEEAKDTKLEIKSTKSGKSSVRKDSYESLKDKDSESIESTRPQQPRCRYVTEDERAELLHGMKKKWDEMMKQFQCLPFLTDTPPKAARKSRMEKDLHQLEKDIQVIERHPYIYVYSDVEETP